MGRYDGSPLPPAPAPAASEYPTYPISTGIPYPVEPGPEYGAGQPGVPEWATPRGMIPPEYPAGTFFVPEPPPRPVRGPGPPEPRFSTPARWLLTDAMRTVPYFLSGGSELLGRQLGGYARTLTGRRIPREAFSQMGTPPTYLPWLVSGISGAMALGEDYPDSAWEQNMWRFRPSYIPAEAEPIYQGVTRSFGRIDPRELPDWLRYDLRPTVSAPPTGSSVLEGYREDTGYYNTLRWLNNLATRIIYPGERTPDVVGGPGWPESPYQDPGIQGMPMPPYQDPGVQGVPMPPGPSRRWTWGERDEEYL